MITLQEYRESLVVVKFLSALHPKMEIASHVRSGAFGRVLHISTRTPSLPDQSFMISSTRGRGRGCDRGHNSGGGHVLFLLQMVDYVLLLVELSMVEMF